MDTIKAYLDSMFHGLPKNERVAQAKVELLGMMEDKYQELKAEGVNENEAIGIVISEFGNLEELSDILGIQQESADKQIYPLISLERCKEYITETQAFAAKLALTTFLLILCVAPIFFMYALYEFQLIRLSKDQLTTFGVIGLFIIIALGLANYYLSPGNLADYTDIKRGQHQLDYATRNYLKREQAYLTNQYQKTLGLAVPLYLISVLPLIFVTAFMEFRHDGYMYLALITMFFMIGYATYRILSVSRILTAYDHLLQERAEPKENHEREKEERKTRSDKIEEVFWAIVLLVYLGWSFLSGDWGTTWIIWPITGILYWIFDTVFEG